MSVHFRSAAHVGAESHHYYRQPTAPTGSDPLQVGDLWSDTTANLLKRCTSLTPITFVSVEGGGGSHDLFSTTHGDVDETDTPTDGQILKYNSAATLWRAEDEAAGHGDNAHDGTILSDVIVNRPVAATVDRFFWATDQHILYRDTGAAWVKASAADHPDLDSIGPNDHHGQSHSDADHTAGFAAPTGAIDIGDAAAEGAAATHSRSDHQHQFAAPGAGYPVDVAAAEADGTATTPARADHGHGHGSGYVPNAHHAQGHGSADHSGAVLAGEANESFGAFYAEMGQITAPANPAAGTRRIFVDSSDGKLKARTSAGSSVSLEEQGGGVTFGPPTGNIDIGDAAVEGVSGDATRADHQHGFIAPGAGYPLDVAAAEADGTATKSARSDHVHAHGSGYSPDAHHARSHDHSQAADGDTVTPATLNIPFTATPAQTAEGQAVWDSDGDRLTLGTGAGRKTLVNGEDAPGGELGGTYDAPTVDATHSGSAHHAQSNSDADHTAGFAAPTGAIDIGDAAAEGAAATHSRSDHQHQFTAPGAGYPVDVAAAEADGAATTPARADHGHAHGSGYLPNAHHNENHGARHADGGADELAVQDLASDAATDGQVAKADGAGAVAFEDDTVGINFIIDGGGSAITTGVKGFVEIPFAMEIEGWTILGDQSGSIVVDVNRSTFAGFPTLSSIAGTELPTLSSAQKNQDLSLTTWTTSIAGGDILEFQVDSVATVQRVTVALRGRKT